MTTEFWPYLCESDWLAMNRKNVGKLIFKKLSSGALILSNKASKDLLGRRFKCNLWQNFLGFAIKHKHFSGPEGALP